MASRRLPFILAMEIESAGWQANSSVGDTQSYPRDEHCQPAVGSCVKKTRERHAVREMKEDPSEPSCRGRLQTAISCFGQKPQGRTLWAKGVTLITRSMDETDE